MSERPCRRLADLLTVTVFLAMLILPLADMVLHLDRSPAIFENRNPAPFPSVSPGTSLAPALLAGLPPYVEDHFGFRRLLIRLNARVRLELLRQSPHRDIILGRHGWLFVASGAPASTEQDLRRQRPFSPGALQQWGESLAARKRWLHERGIAYLFVVAPNKHSVYPEMLPGWLHPAPGPSRLDQLSRHLLADPGSPFLDLRPALGPYLSGYPLYFALDSHWNDVGGLVAATAVAAAASRLLSGLQPLPWEKATVWWADRGGDLAFMTGIQDRLSERVPMTAFAERPGSSEANLEPCEPCGPPLLPLLPATAFEQPGVPWRGLLLGDSFRVALVPALRASFGRLVVVSPAQLPTPHQTLARLIEKERPHIVIEERVERLLGEPPELPPSAGRS